MTTPKTENTDGPQFAASRGSAPRGLGSFAPTCAWNEASKVLYVTLEMKQMIATTRDAANPADNSESAQWGRAMLQEIASLYEKYCEEHGTCEVRIVRRRYDDEPV